MKGGVVLNLEDFRKALESDARSNVRILEEELMRLRMENESQRKYIAALRADVSALNSENDKLRRELAKHQPGDQNGFHLDPKNPNTLATLYMLGTMI